MKKGKLTLASRYATVIGKKKFTAARTFPTSDSVSKNNRKGPKVKNGQEVIVKKVYFAKNGINKFQISVNGKTGWVSEEEEALLK